MRALKPTDTEPNHGSVVLLEGVSGTAYQRLFSTGMWHSTTGGLQRPLRWQELLDKVAARRGSLPILLVHEVTADGVAVAHQADEAGLAVALRAHGLSVDKTADVLGTLAELLRVG